MKSRELSDKSIEKRISKLREAIVAWARKKELWDEEETTFWSHIEYFDDEPKQFPCLLVLTGGGDLGDLMYYGNDGELDDEFRSLLKTMDVYFEVETGGVYTFWLSSDNDPQLEELREYFEWEWICGLIEPEFSSLYDEIFAWFSKKQEDFYRLSPRQYEVIIDGILRNNGYRTQLGTGQADGGVDIRLYSNEVIGEAVTLVQAKRYAEHLPVGLEAIQALSAAVEDERANRGLFVTTSRYLPGAKEFAARQNRKLTLATNEDLARWSNYARASVIEDKSKLVSANYVESVVIGKAKAGSIEGIIFRANTGVTMIMNSFALVLKETKTAALLMRLPTKETSGDGQVGYEIPVRVSNLSSSTVFRAKKRFSSDGEVSLWGEKQLYFQWDGKPTYFNYLD